VSGNRPALEALSAAEKAAVLDELLTARPDLREPAEAYAAQVMTDADRVAVADDVESALQGRDIEELNTRAGHRPGRGYVHPAEAADEILDEALQPFLDDLHRRAGLGMRSATAELAAGILLGLYSCRHGTSETLLEYAPDYAAERASGVVRDCARLGIELPAVELLDLMPEWSALLRCPPGELNAAGEGRLYAAGAQAALRRTGAEDSGHRCGRDGADAKCASQRRA